MARYQRRPPNEARDGSAISAPLAGYDLRHHLIVDRHIVPYLRLTDVTTSWEAPAVSAEWADEGRRLQKAAIENGERIFDVSLDDRFGHTATEREIEAWAWFLANCMAVSAGYTSHGENSRPINRHGPSRI